MVTGKKISHSKEFDGDIIITDPCYIIRKSEHNDDWDKSSCGECLDRLGIKTFISRDTLYGDWSCTTINAITKEKMGEFCADSGRVAVISLDEVLKYNPEFDYHINRLWTTTLIKNFKGTVRFEVVHTVGEYEEDTKYWKKGDKWEDDSVIVTGDGVDKLTNAPINFIAYQTGL